MFKNFPRLLVAHIVSLSIMIGLYLIMYTHLPPETPIFYSVPESENQIGPMWAILILPLIQFALVSINYFVKKRWFSEEPMFSAMLTYLSYAVILVSTYIFVTIIFHIT